MFNGLILLAELTCTTIHVGNHCQTCCESETVRACKFIDKCEPEKIIKPAGEDGPEPATQPEMYIEDSL
jgi:hypothetical protein